MVGDNDGKGVMEAGLALQFWGRVSAWYFQRSQRTTFSFMLVAEKCVAARSCMPKHS